MKSIQDIIDEQNVINTNSIDEQDQQINSSIKDEYILSGDKINESQIYDELICKLQEAKENNTPINEGLFSAILGGITGVTFGPAIMKSLCKILGVDPKGQFGSLLTSRLVLGALATEVGWRQ